MHNGPRCFTVRPAGGRWGLGLNAQRRHGTRGPGHGTGPRTQRWCHKTFDRGLVVISAQTGEGVRVSLKGGFGVGGPRRPSQGTVSC